ncbi:MAG: TolC family protein [Planctomycetes bacterium]|nr:TolC family protein [Planctomycetota bacterium]
MRTGRRVSWAMGAMVGLLVAGCASPRANIRPERPNVAPPDSSTPSEALKLDASDVKPMYTEMLAVDLSSVVRVAAAQNFDIELARQNVVASRGELESTVGAVFPAIVPTALFEHVTGTVRATEGNLVGVGFNTFQPSIAVQWVVNPGRVIYDIIAAKKRFSAAAHQERAVILETLRRSAVQYYDLVLTQARVSAAHQGVMEAEELLRINRLRTQTGVGIPADELRAQARLAERRQDLILAMKDFYDASVALSLTLHLDSSVTLVPSIDELPPVHLVRRDLSIEELLDIAITFRPDLEEVRTLVEAAAADRGSTWWGAFGPEFQASYQYGGITGHANNVLEREGIPSNLIVNPASSTGSFGSNPFANGLIKEGILRGSRRAGRRDDQTFGFSDQQRVKVGVGWRLSLSAFGNLKTSGARQEQARIEAEMQLDLVKAQVVNAAQASRANAELVGFARQQVEAAAEALRLSEANLRAGAATTLDVLQAQDAATQARLRHAGAVVRYNQSQVNLLAFLGLLDKPSLTPSPPQEL